ncbi:hypothetical protein L208DRAFT_1394836 [Tricholoma matsutake]|nr:hypothetical protein L208DRAFT_1394836 [Tricholoma matsutake 945]
MHLPKLVRRCTTVCVILGCLAARTSAYFVITEPTLSSQWVEGGVHPVRWTKGVDAINSFDVELSRLSQDGLIFVARNVLGKSASLNIKVNGLAPGDDYFLIFINSTHGVLHATSPRFTILPASSSPNSSQPSPISGATTVTVSTGPDPTQPFATTFAAIGSGDLPRWGSASEAWGLGSVVVGCFVGAAWTLW